MSKILIAGPCVHEQSVQWLVDQAGAIHDALFPQRDITWIFKCSFDKANRTSIGSFRGLGLDKTLEAFREIKKLFGCLVTTDVHECWQITELGSTVDVIQIPAMLSRQTDLIQDAAKATQVNIKVGTNMTYEQAMNALVKSRHLKPWLTYRGTAYGRELVFDPLRLWELMPHTITIADVTHSTAGHPGAQLIYARVAAALDVDGLFIECHPNPKKALSDGEMQLPIARLNELLEGLTWGR
jgi:2-dehydro-3-deoxyphosphooctonate aldolase (KDO 8-P synthase)